MTATRTDSWIDRYVSQVQEFTDSPLLLIRASAYFTMAAALRKQAFYRANCDVYPNFYLIIVGPPEKFRKTYSLELGMEMIRRVVPSCHLLPQGGSDSGFDDALVDARGYGIAYYEELMEFLALSGQEHNSQLSAKFLRYFHPSGIAYKLRTRGDGERKIPAGSVVSMASACVDDQFQKFMMGGALSSGQISRCLVLRPTERDLRASKPIEAKIPRSFYEECSRELYDLIPKKQVEMIFTPDAVDAISEYAGGYVEWKYRNRNPLLWTATTRFLAIMKRLAMIRAADRRSSEISSEDVDRVYEEMLEPYLRTIKNFIRFGIQERPDQKVRARIMAQLDMGPSSERVLSLHLNEPVHTIHTNLEILKDMGEVHEEDVSGRALWCNGWCGHKNELEEEMKAINEYCARVESERKGESK